MANASLDLNFNITIKVLDKYDKVVHVQKVHNKANSSLVSGILQFIQGIFNPSEFNDPYEKYSDPEQSIINNAYGAKRYIPSCTGVGDIGVEINTTTHKITEIDDSVMVKPTFFETDLQKPLIHTHAVPRLKFRRVVPTRGGDRNNALGLSLVTVLPKGYLLYNYDENGEVVRDNDGKPVYTDDYFEYRGIDGTSSPKNAVLITEIGLFSNTDPNSGMLLARVLLDGKLSDDPELAGIGIMKDDDYSYNPLIQTVDSSVIIEWEIVITSIGSNDEVVSEPVVSDMQIEIITDD